MIKIHTHMLTNIVSGLLSDSIQNGAQTLPVISTALTWNVITNARALTDNRLINPGAVWWPSIPCGNCIIAWGYWDILPAIMKEVYDKSLLQYKVNISSHFYWRHKKKQTVCISHGKYWVYGWILVYVRYVHMNMIYVLYICHIALFWNPSRSYSPS